MSKWKKVALWKKILIGVVIGLIIGLVSPKAAEVISPLGDIFLRMLKMLIVPLVFFSITSGVCKMGDVKQLRTVGIRYVLWIMASAVIAAICGVIGGLIVQPGRGTTEFLAAAEAAEQAFFAEHPEIAGEDILDEELRLEQEQQEREAAEEAESADSTGSTGNAEGAAEPAEEPAEEPVESEPADVPAEAVAAEDTTTKKSFWGRLRAGLTKTRNALFAPVDSLLRNFTKVDEDLLDLLDAAQGLLMSINSAVVLAAAALGVSAISDILDGYIARHYNQVTDFGKFMDPVADKFMVIGTLMALLFRMTHPEYYGLSYSTVFKILFFVDVIIIIFREFAITSLR